jgi:hypothetical protein
MHREDVVVVSRLCREPVCFVLGCQVLASSSHPSKRRHERRQVALLRSFVALADGVVSTYPTHSLDVALIAAHPVQARSLVTR